MSATMLIQQHRMPPLVTEVLRQRQQELEDLEWSDTTSTAAALRRRMLRFEIVRLKELHRKGETHDPQH